MKHWTTEQIREACDYIGGYPNTYKQQQDMFKDVLEQRDVAVGVLRRLADKENVNRAIASVSRFGSAGAGVAYGEVQKYAAETLAKKGLGNAKATAPADGLCDAVSVLGTKCKDLWMHGGDWHYGGAGMCWPR